MCERRVKAIKQFMELDHSEQRNKELMLKIYKDIFGIRERYLFASAIDLFVDIKHFLADGLYRINISEDICWYKDDFMAVGIEEMKGNSNIRYSEHIFIR